MLLKRNYSYYFLRNNHIRNIIHYLSIYFNNRATKPIDLLIKLLKILQKGDFSNSILIESHDEIEELAENFNYMNFKINALLKDIQKADNL